MSDVETNDARDVCMKPLARMRTHTCAREVTRVNAGHARYNGEEESVIVPSSGACETHKSRISPGLPVSRETFAHPRHKAATYLRVNIRNAGSRGGHHPAAFAAGVRWLLNAGTRTHLGGGGIGWFFEPCNDPDLAIVLTH